MVYQCICVAIIKNFSMDNYISKEGLEKLKEELARLKERRHEIAQKIEEAKALGDLSENNEYHEARETQSFNEGRIRELEEKVKNAKIITGRGKKPDAVQVGSQITVKNGGQKIDYWLVGSEEANPLAGKISNESPIGKAFLNKKIGEEVIVETPRGKVKYKILAIN